LNPLGPVAKFDCQVAKDRSIIHSFPLTLATTRGALTMLRTSAIALSLLAAMIFSSVALAQATKGKLKPPEVGDVVEVEHFREVKVGKVTKVMGDGAIFWVELEDQERPFPAKQVRYPKDKAAAAKIIAERDAAKNGTPSSGGGSKKKRTWTDSTGKFKIDATFVELKDGKVKLTKDDGSEVSIPLEKLSGPDQEIANLMAEGGLKPSNDDDANPFQSTGKSSPSLTGEVEGNPADARKIIFEAPENWNVKPDPSATQGPKLAAKSIALPKRKPAKGQNSFFESATGVSLNAAKGHVFVTVKDGTPGGKNQMRLEVVDATTGNPAGMHELPRPFTIKSFSPSGNRLATLNDDDFFKRLELVDIWNVEGKLDHVTSLRPYPTKEAGRGNKVIEAEFLEDSRLATLSDQGLLVVWEIPAGKPLWSAEVKDWSRAMAISPGGKQIAVKNNEAVWVLDAAKGEVLGKLELPSPAAGGSRLTFKPDGQQLAFFSGVQLMVWDVASGKPVVNEQSMMVPSHGTELAFGADGQTLVFDHEWVIDLNRRLVLAKYVGGEVPTVAAGRRWSLLSQHERGEKSHTVVHIAIPSKDLLDKAASANEESLLAIKPGTSISLAMAPTFDGPTHDRIKQSLFDRFKLNGWKPVDGGGEAVLEMKVAQGKSEEREYRSFGFGSGGTQKVTITPLIGTIELKLGGKAIWNSTAHWAPGHFLHLREGQTIQDATQVKPSPDFFANAPIPKRIFAYPKGGALYQATVSIGGVKIE